MAVVLGGVSARQRFGDLKVIRTGLRGGQTAGRPRGHPAAECRCRCGTVTVVPLYRLLSGNTRSCGCQACFRPRQGGIRDTIVAYVGEQGGAWMTQIRDALGLTSGAAGGHLYYLAVRAGRLERPARGFYCLPGRVPDPLPPRPGQARPAGNSKAGRARWANMTQAERDKRVAALTAGRARAAGKRQEAGAT